MNKFKEVIEKYTYIENGAIRRTTCCEFLGPFRLGIKAGSKSGGKYLFNTKCH
jgi:hypothetical protein